MAKKHNCEGYFQCRHVLAFLCSMALAILYGLKVNFSVAIVAMVNHTQLELNHQLDSAGSHQAASEFGPPVYSLGDGADSESGGAPGGGEQKTEVIFFDERRNRNAPDEITANDTLDGVNDINIKIIERDFEDGPFVWDEITQGLILSSYFWGYLLTELPGGRLAEVFSGKWVMWTSVFCNAFLTLLTPVAANLGHLWLIVIRIAEGLAGGLSFPATHVMIAKWTPPQERSKMASIIYSGTALGTVSSLPFSGLLASAFGWESIFYVQGGLSLIWCVLWIFFIYDSPETHPRITNEERSFIMNSLGDHGSHCGRKVDFPWRSVFLSAPFYAILISHICSNFGWYLLLVELPTFFKHILLFDIKKNSLLSAVPFLFMWLFCIVYSNRLDWAREMEYISTTNARKLSTCIASLVPGLCLVLISFVCCDQVIVMILLTVGIMCIGAKFSGFLTNHIDIAPNFAGTLIGITNTIATTSGFIVTMFVASLTHGNQTMGQWQIIFLTTAGIFAVEAVVFTIWGSGKEQAWSHGEKEVGTRSRSSSAAPIHFSPTVGCVTQEKSPI